MKKTQLLLLLCVLVLLNNKAKAQYRPTGLSIHYNLLNSTNLIFKHTKVQSASFEFQLQDHIKIEATMGAGNRTYNARANFRTQLKSKFVGYGLSFLAKRITIGVGLRHIWTNQYGQFTFDNSHSDPVYLSSKNKINITAAEFKLSYLISFKRLYLDPYIGIRYVTHYKTALPFTISEIPGLSSINGPASNPFIGLNIGILLLDSDKSSEKNK